MAPHWVALIGLIRTPCVQQKVTKETKNTNTVALIGLIRTRFGPRLGVNNRVWWQREPMLSRGTSPSTTWYGVPATGSMASDGNGLSVQILQWVG